MKPPTVKLAATLTVVLLVITIINLVGQWWVYAAICGVLTLIWAVATVFAVRRRDSGVSESGAVNPPRP